MRQQQMTMVLVAGGLVLLLAWAGRLGIAGLTRHAGPQNIAEAIAVAEKLGLHQFRDGCVDPANHMAVSETPLTPERVALACLNYPASSRWAGMVRIYWPAPRMMPNYDPACSAVWGEVFVYGDPKLIKKLMEAR